MRRKLITMACILPCVVGTPLPGQALDVNDLVQRITESERRLNAAIADFRVRWERTALVYWEGQWGREGAKGFLRGWASVKWEDGRRSRYQEIYAFDGERLRTFQPEPDRLRGSVRELGNDLDSPPTPGVLLGQSIRKEGRYTLGELLREAQKVEVVSRTERVHEAECVVLAFDVEGYHTATDGTKTPYSRLTKVWVDTKRDYRPLRIECYRDVNGQQLAQVVDDIALQQIEGVWVPMSGRSTFYRNKVTSLGLRVERVPSELGPKRIEITSWQVLRDIDDALFTITFPTGSTIWDDFLQTAVHVGGDQSNLAETEGLGIEHTDSDTDGLRDELRAGKGWTDERASYHAQPENQGRQTMNVARMWPLALVVLVVAAGLAVLLLWRAHTSRSG